MPRVGIDLRATEEGFKAHFGRGTGRYVSELAPRLLDLSSRELGIEGFHTTELCPSIGLRQLFQRIPFGRQTLETHLYLPGILPQLGVDLMHFFSHGDAPSRGDFPFVITVLDLIPLRFRELYRPERNSWRYDLARSLEHRAIKRSAGILAISEATKRDLTEFLGIHPDRVFVTPLAVGSAFSPGDGSEIRRNLLQGREERIALLYVGGIDPRKNVPFLLSILEELHRAGRKAQLVLVGRHEKEREYPALVAEINRRGLTDDVTLAGFVSDEELPGYYRAADVVLFPSLYEGFGFPVLEAMACGVPVLAGRNSSMPELYGSEGELLSDSDLSAWTGGILAVLDESGRREALVAHGLKRAALFSWDRTARMTREAYQYFLTRGSR